MSDKGAIIPPRVPDTPMRGDDVRRTCGMANHKKQGIKSLCDNIMMLNLEPVSMPKVAVAVLPLGSIRMTRETGITPMARGHSLIYAPLWPITKKPIKTS